MTEVFILLLGMALGAMLAYAFLRKETQAQQEAYAQAMQTQQLQTSQSQDLLKQSFEASARQALSQNTEDFLRLAELLLSKKTANSEQQLEHKKTLIDETLQRMHRDLANTQQLLAKFEQDRSRQYGQLSQQLQQTAMQTAQLHDSTAQLRQLLSNTKARGQWGERMAADVLQAIGFQEGINYVKQQTLTQGGRPDITFLLPKGLALHMDVKFPLDNYLRFFEAESADDRAKYRDSFLKDVSLRLKEASVRQYSHEADAIDYVLVFIPNEAIYSFILSEKPSIIDEALSQRAILCSPFTLYAILAIVRQAVEFFNMEAQSNEILEALGAFKTEWEKYTSGMDRLGKRIEDAQKEFQQLQSTRKRQLDRSISNIELLKEGKATVDRETND